MVKISSLDEAKMIKKMRHALFPLVTWWGLYSVDSVDALKSTGEPSSLRWIPQDQNFSYNFSGHRINTQHRKTARLPEWN